MDKNRKNFFSSTDSERKINTNDILLLADKLDKHKHDNKYTQYKNIHVLSRLAINTNMLIHVVEYIYYS